MGKASDFTTASTLSDAIEGIDQEELL